MPELPEVETMVRGIRPHVEGRTIQTFADCGCPCRPMSVTPGIREISRRCRGHQVIRVERLAKRALLRLSNGLVLAIEPRMTGLLLIDDPPDTGHLRLEWTFDDSLSPRRLWFWDRRGLGTARLYSADECHQVLGPDRLGPDALRITINEWQERLLRTGRQVKIALLDQRLVAGIGNLYASEILHLSKIHPEHRCDQLNRDQIQRLAAATSEVLNTAIKYEGSTLSDGTYRNALNKTGRYQNEHRVYAKADQRCASCGRGRIRRIVQAQRSTFFCPVCQRIRPRRRSLGHT